MRYFSFLQRSSLIVLAVALAGCATNPGITKLGPDTYTLYQADHGGIFGNATLMRTEVINRANVFAESQGKVAYPISANTHPMGCCGDWATFEYQFRLADKNDSTAHKTYLIPGSDVVADETGKVAGAVVTKNQPEKTTDVYIELTKLDNLRKKGIISEAEFEAQKKKILNRN